MFEDNAEFGFGMYLATKTRREQAFDELKALSSMNINPELKAAIDKMIANKDTQLSGLAACELAQALAKAKGGDAAAKEAIKVAQSKTDLYAKISQ